MNYFGTIRKMSFAAFLAMAIVSCKTDSLQDRDSLSVEPSGSVTFQSQDNQNVILSVTTSAADWDFTAPEWVKTSKKDVALVINAEDNLSAEDRSGDIVFTAGDAEPVKINVLQLKDEEIAKGARVSFNMLSENLVNVGTETTFSLKVNISIEQPLDFDVVANIEYDEAYLEEYIFENGGNCSLFPKEKVQFGTTLTIAKGETVSPEMEIKITDAELEYGAGYLVPLKATVGADAGAYFPEETSRANYVLMRQNTKTIKNVVFFEVNDCNPLNALEYVLADGTQFIDAVVLFAANINYDSGVDRVYLNNNPNVQALLDETDVYLQPLRKKGIKVYLGLLGNHGQAGLCQLSDWGAAEWAKEVALAVREYRLDGVTLDDEYSAARPDLENPWFTSPSPEAGSRLMYELKKAMREECYWPTEVSYYVYGKLAYNVSAVKDQETKETHQPSTFVDFYVADYGGASHPYADFDMSDCCGSSIQCNYGAVMTEYAAQNIKNDGYGWCMWFAFDPSGTGSVKSNLSTSFNAMSNAARGFYGQELQRPTGVYNKIGEGKYDPTRHDLDF